MPRAEYLLANIWNRVEGGRLQTEGVLEDALAAALEAPGVWEKLHPHLGLSADIPRDSPDVSTQEVVEEGRTDITLRWLNGYSLNLELKVDGGPGKDQIDRYLRCDVDVLAIARLPGHIDAYEIDGRKYRGVVTWSRLRNLEWSEAPLEWRQFLHLLDTTGVVVKKVDRAELEGIIRSWDTWDTLQEWSREGMEAVLETLQKADLNWVYKEKKRQRVRVDMTHQRIVWWMWHPPWQHDSLAIYAGFFMGRPQAANKDPVLEPGLPDLMLAFHVDPASRRGTLFREDSELQKSVKQWASRAAVGDAIREPRLDGHEWEILRFRQSARIVSEAPDPGKMVVDWMRDRTQEWIEDRIVQRITKLAKSV